MDTKQALEILKKEGIFWSRLGFSVDPPIFDKDNNLLLQLQKHESKELYLEQGRKYLLVLRARSADGAHQLEWE